MVALTALDRAAAFGRGNLQVPLSSGAVPAKGVLLAGTGEDAEAASSYTDRHPQRHAERVELACQPDLTRVV